MTPFKEEPRQEATDEPTVTVDLPYVLAIYPPDERHVLEPLKKMGFRIVYLNEVEE